MRAVELQHCVVALVAFPVFVVRFLIEHVELDRAQWDLRLANQPAQVAQSAAGCVQGDHFVIGEPDRAVFDVHALPPEEQFRGACLEPVIFAIEYAAQ